MKEIVEVNCCVLFEFLLGYLYVYDLVKEEFFVE